jgi:hypothetical protein
LSDTGLTGEGRGSGWSEPDDGEALIVDGTCSGRWCAEGKESVYSRIEITNKTTVAKICLYRVLERATLRGAYMMPPQPNLLLCEV